MPPSKTLKVLLLAGPPASASLWRDVQRRLESTFEVEALELFDPTPEDPTVDGLVGRVVARGRALGGPLVVVGHGAAVPVAWRAAARLEAHALVLSNGPLTGLDPVLRGVCGLAKAPRLLATSLLQPAILRTWLKSSVGLRRAAVNPYVADHDTVVALLDPLIRDQTRRLATARFLQSLPSALQSPPSSRCPTLLLWGEADPLYPPRDVDKSRVFFDQPEVSFIEGGQHLHPIERPWAFADALANWLTRQGTAT